MEFCPSTGDPVNDPAQTPSTNEQPAVYRWSRGLRGAVSTMLVLYLAVVVLGPLSNPIASADLTGPLGRYVAPVHQALFLGHGYRFFGPDPGPGHLLVYKIKTRDGREIEGKFPDRNRHRPRLLYHRWFMLSETIFEEHALMPDKSSHHQS